MRINGPKHYVLVALFAFVVSSALFGFDLISNPLAQGPATPVADSLRSEFAGTGGDELSLVYIGSSTCRWSNIPELQTAVRTAIENLREYGAENGYHVSEVGVARDLSVRAGLKHLNELAQFDEVVAGRGWMNTGLLRYVHDQFPGEAATPQVLVVLRRVNLAPERSIEAEAVVLRKVGATEIQNWATAGALLPKDVDALLDSGSG